MRGIVRLLMVCGKFIWYVYFLTIWPEHGTFGVRLNCSSTVLLLYYCMARLLNLYCTAAWCLYSTSITICLLVARTARRTIFLHSTYAVCLLYECTVRLLQCFCVLPVLHFKCTSARFLNCTLRVRLHGASSSHIPSYSKLLAVQVDHCTSAWCIREVHSLTCQIWTLCGRIISQAGFPFLFCLPTQRIL